MTLLTAASGSALPRLRSIELSWRCPTAAELMMAIGVLLGGGMLLSILTTSDPLWWQFAFSVMGTFHDFSGYVFNVTIILSSALLVAFGVRLRVEMRTHAGTPVLVSRRAAVIVPILLVNMGLFLSLVGFFPLNVSEAIHEKGPLGALLSFAIIIGASRWLLKGMHRHVARGTRRAGLVLGMSIPPYIAGFINMTLFELIVFAVMVSWLLLVARNLGRPSDAPTETATAKSEVRAQQCTETQLVPRVHVIARGRSKTRATTAAGMRPLRRQHVAGATFSATHHTTPTHSITTSVRPVRSSRPYGSAPVPVSARRSMSTFARGGHAAAPAPRRWKQGEAGHNNRRGVNRVTRSRARNYANTVR